MLETANTEITYTSLYIQLNTELTGGFLFYFFVEFVMQVTCSNAFYA